ncbi:hypothetical protein ACFPVX_10085 [Cohnella faecalis]|uniref:hypothetical protein n=1 Tax=Cohnella faecalis TaxID=2315694 RepID=UPI0011C21579|nr:hypothetical protein [Cohnella faecalis]
MHDQSDFFDVAEKMSKASSLMPYELLKESMQCKNESDIEKRKGLIEELYTKIKDEILRLKRNQYDSITSKSSDGVTSIENFMKSKLAPFVYPLMPTFCNLVLLLLTIYFIFLMSESTITQQILYISVVMAVVIYGTLMISMVSLVIIKKRFNNSWLNWMLFFLFVLSPLSLFEGPWYRGIIAIVLIIAYGFYAAKKSIKKSIP